jgi:N-acetylmuramoyl-L-alanine amidase
MRQCSALIVAVLVALSWGQRCRAEPARPIETVRIRASDAVLPQAAVGLYDGREVYVGLDVARALRCNIAVREREDSAIVSGPQGQRREIGLARLRNAPMLPLSSLGPMLGIQYAVKDGVCEIRSSAAAAPSRAVKTPPAAASDRGKPGDVPPAPTDVPADVSPSKPATPPQSGSVQQAESIDPEPANRSSVLPWRSTGAQAVPRAVVTPQDGVVQPGPAPLGPTGARQPTRIRDIVCEAIDPAQARIAIFADGPLKPSVRMVRGMTELAVDVPSAVLDSARTEWTFDNPLIRRARVTSTGAPGVVRIAFDLARLITYRAQPAPPDAFEIIARLPKLVGRRFEEMTVVVDPGHGGPSASGCSAIVNGSRVFEKDLNLKIGRLVYDNLRRSGLSVLMTRSVDTAVSLSERPAVANTNLADIFVSIHVDDAPGNPLASGPTAYYHGADEDSRALGFSIVEAVAAAGGMVGRGSRSDLSRFATGMAVLRRAEMAAILIEIAYISNARDRAKLLTSEFQGAVARAIADGIRRYVEGKLPEAAPALPEEPK